MCDFILKIPQEVAHMTNLRESKESELNESIKKGQFRATNEVARLVDG